MSLHNYESSFENRRTFGDSKLKFESIERTLYKLRDKAYPDRPSTHEEVRDKLNEAEIIEEYGLTLNK